MTATTARVTFEKVPTGASGTSTYTVLLDDEPIGTVSRVREHYLKRLGGHRGNNVHRSRTAWIVDGSHLSYKDTRAEAAIALLTETRGMSYGEALDLVRNKPWGAR